MINVQGIAQGKIEDTFIKNLQETYGGRLSPSYLSELSKSKGSQ
jgi:hypothetical protein